MPDPPPNTIGTSFGTIRSPLPLDKLNAYLEEHMAGRVRLPVEVQQFKFGQSNPTYFLTDSAGSRFVLRKKPPGTLLSPTAHAVEREYTILRALHTHNTLPSTPAHLRVPVPEVYALCRDEGVLGTPFYVMEFLEGRVFVDVEMPGVPAEERRACWLSAIRTLAALSSLSPSSLGLASYGPSTPYFPRQLRSLSRVSSAQSAVLDVDSRTPVGPIPGFEDMVRWFGGHLPREEGVRIVHGDYKLDNLVFHKTEPRVIGILDWELSTLGSPLADLGNLLMPWFVDQNSLPAVAAQEAFWRGFKSLPPEQMRAPQLGEMVRAYEQAAGWEVRGEEMRFAASWTFFRLAVILQGIAARYARRQASSEKAQQQAEMFPYVGRMARALMDADTGGAGAETEGGKAKL